MIFQSEKTLNDLGDKVSESEKAEVKIAIDKLKETVKGNDTEAIKADTESLEKSFYAISEKLYKQAQESGAQSGGTAQESNGDFYQDDFEDKTK